MGSGKLRGTVGCRTAVVHGLSDVKATVSWLNNAAWTWSGRWPVQSQFRYRLVLLQAHAASPVAPHSTLHITN